MGEVILETNIKREEGWLYYCGTSKNGNVNIGKAKMARKGKSKK